MYKFIIVCTILFINSCVAHKINYYDNLYKTNILDKSINDLIAKENSRTNNYFKDNEELLSLIINEFQVNKSTKKIEENCNTKIFNNNELITCIKYGLPSFFVVDKPNKNNWQNIYSVNNYKHYHYKDAKLTKDGKYFLLAEDINNSGNFTIKIIDTHKRKIIASITNTNGQIYPFKKNSFFYVSLNKDTLKAEKVILYEIEFKINEIVFNSKLINYNIDLYISSSKKYLVINELGSFDSQSHLIDLNDYITKPVLFRPLSRNVKYHLDHINNDFYIRGNIDNKFSLYTTNSYFGKLKRITSKNDNIEDYAVLKDYIVILTRKKGMPIVKKISLTNNNEEVINFKDKNFLIQFISDNNQKNNIITYEISSLTIPKQKVKLNLDTNEKEISYIDNIKNYNSDDYISEYLLYKSFDGEEVPVSIVYKKNLFQKFKNPLLIYVYGAYGSNIEPRFSSNRLSLLNRGFIYAIIHVRGGGELGEKWHLDGKLLNKKNTFKDFISITKVLHKEGYGDKNRTYALGEGAGGLIMGYIINNSPNLYQAVVAVNPLVDLIGEILNSNNHYKQSEYNEWGNPNNKTEFNYMKSYSPYDNITKNQYPAIYATAIINNEQTKFISVLNWIVKLRLFDIQEDENKPILLETNLKSGNEYGQSILNNIAKIYTFIINIDNSLKK